MIKADEEFSKSQSSSSREAEQNKLLKAALWYHKKGYSVIPCKPRSKKALVSWTEYQRQSPTESKIREWWEKNPNANIAIMLGKVSGVITLEVDDEKAIDGKPIPATPQAISGGKKMPHFYFKCPSVNFSNYKAHEKGRELFSIRGNGQYVLAPPSIHPSGNLYEWASGLGIHEVEPADPPDWTLELIVNNQAKEEAERYYKRQDNRYTDNLRRYIEKLKSKIRVSDLLIHLGIEKTEEKGRYIQFNCPFHESEGKKSFTVWDDVGIGKDWHDEKSYDCIEFVRAYKNLEFNETLNYLADYAKVEPYIFNSEEDRSPKQSQADLLVALIGKLPIILFHDEYEDPYARFRVGEHFEIRKIRSRQFKRWISHEFWNIEEKVPNSDSINSALNVIEAKACFDGDKHELHNRVAWHEGAIWYDLGNWKAVKTNREGWEIVNEPPILFRRYSHQKAQSIPRSCDIKEIEKIFDFVNIRNDEHRLLYIASLICSFIPDIPHPIDVLHGDQGTAKTTALKIKKELTDPSETKTLTFPSTIAEFVQQASHHWLIPLDNLTVLPEWLSDALCRTVTGEGFSKRELYTDDEDIIYRFKRCPSINGINLVPTKPDLLDRSLIFELDPIPPEKKKNEVELWNEFEEEKPKILGALFSLISKAMKEYDNVKLTRKPRMADFATWGCAVARAIGKEDKDFITAYFDNIKIQNEEAIEASPVARVIMNFMDGREKWEGTPSDLLEELNEIATELKLNTKDKRYPKDSRWLWRRIKEVRTNLQAVGIEAIKDDSDRDSSGRKIVLKRIPQPDRPKEEDPEKSKGEDTSQQGEKNDVSDGMMSENQEYQELTSDIISDNTNRNENDVRNDVRPNHAKTLETDNTDNTDNISETSLEDDAELEHGEFCDCAECCPNVDPWERQ